MKKAMIRKKIVMSIVFMFTSISYAGGAGKSAITLGEAFSAWWRGAPEVTSDAARNADTARNVPPVAAAMGPDGKPMPANVAITLDNITEAMTGQPDIKGIQVIARRLSDVLMRTVKSAAIMVAPAGSGKTALSRGIAHLIETNARVVRNLAGYRTLRVDWQKIVGNTKYQGEFEARMIEFKRIIAENRDSKIILVFDELEEILRNEQGLKFLTSLKTEFSEETGVKFIFNITPGPFNELMKDPQLIRRLYKLMGEVPSDEVVMDILMHMKDQAFKDHGVVISQRHLDSIMEISKKHPELGNPDGAITLLEDARIMATSDMLKGDVRVDELIAEIEQNRTTINNILRNREEGDPKYFGSYYDEFLAARESKIIEAENYIKQFEAVYDATDAKRIRLISKIEERAELFKSNVNNIVNDADGAMTDSELEIARLTAEITKLSDEITESSVLLQGGELKDIHIVRTGMTYLNKTENEVQQIIHGTPSVAALSSRILEAVNQTEEAVTSVLTRIIRKRRFHNDEKALGVLLVSDESTKNADMFARSISEEVIGRAPFKIPGSSVKRETDLTTLMGVTESFAGFKEGVLSGRMFTNLRESNGNLMYHIPNPELSHPDFQGRIANMITDGSASNNLGQDTNFTEAIFMLTMKGVEPLTAAQRSHVAGLSSDLLRQDYLKSVVKRKFRREGITFDEDLLDELYIVFTHVDEAPVSNLKALVAEKIRDVSLRNFFSDKFKISMNFSDEYVDYLFDLVKQVGANRIDELIESDIEPQILAFQQSFQIISGDNVMLDIAQDGSVIVRVEEWADPQQRELALEAAKAAQRLTDGEVPMTDEVDEIRQGLSEF